MSNEAAGAVRSPSYPVMSLSSALAEVAKIESQYRSAKVDRVVAAKIAGYSGLSGPANKALAALAQYGLVERAGKGEMRVTARARAILHPDSQAEKQSELRAAAFEPQLFRELQERYPNMHPPEDGVVMFLNRKGFNQSAIRPAAKAYLQTLLDLEEAGVSESHSHGGDVDAESSSPAPTNRPEFGGAKISDLIQWEAGGALQLEKPMRVRAVSEDGQWVLVEGSESGIPMSEVIVEERAAASAPPVFKFAEAQPPSASALSGESEWMRSLVGRDTKVRLLVSGGEMGAKEIGKLMKLLEAQRAVLADDDDDG